MDVSVMCRCCLRCAPDKDLTTPYTYLGKTEIYADMIKNCFAINLQLESGSRGVCWACVSRLRDAIDFKLQVQKSQTELEALLVEDKPAVEPIPAENSAEDVRGFNVILDEPIVKSEILNENDTDGDPLVQLEEADLVTGDDTDDLLRIDGDPLVQLEEADLVTGDDTDDLLRIASVEGPNNGSVRLHTAPPHGAAPPSSTITSKTGSPRYQCHDCGKRFRNETVLTKHMHIHMSTKPSLESSPASARNQRSLPAQSSLQSHARVHTSEKQCQGNDCVIFKDNLERRVRSRTKVTHMCSFCDYKSTMKDNVRQHMRSHTGEKPFQCSICDYKSIRKSGLKRHLELHPAEKYFQCNDCDYKCNVKKTLRQHVKTHIVPRIYTCNICDFKSTWKNNLRQHMVKHTGEKNFQCDLCDFKFSSKSHLKKHLELHPPEKYFQCNDCDYKCNLKRYLRTHVKTHIVPKMYICSICDFKTYQILNYQSHLYKHTGGKPYQCSICNKKYASESTLRNHKTQHSGVKLL